MSSKLAQDNDGNLSEGLPVKHLSKRPKRSNRTLQERIDEHLRPDGKRGLRVRELTKAMRVGAETLKVSLLQPERFSLASILALAQLLNVTPTDLMADIVYQISLRNDVQQPPTGRHPHTRHRHLPTPDAAQAPTAASSDEREPETAPPTDPAGAHADQAKALSAASLPIPTELTPEPDPTASPEDLAEQVPYAQATFQQRMLAVAHLQQELKAHFPALPLPRWVKELDALHPDLWLEGEQVVLEYPDLVTLTQRLAYAPEIPTLDPPIYGPRALLLARRLTDYAELAVRALAELEQTPLAQGAYVYTRGILLKLAAGNGLAEEVMQVFRENSTPASPDYAPDLIPGCAAVRNRIFNLGWRHGKPSGFQE